MSRRRWWAARLMLVCAAALVVGAVFVDGEAFATTAPSGGSNTVPFPAWGYSCHTSCATNLGVNCNVEVWDNVNLVTGSNEISFACSGEFLTTDTTVLDSLYVTPPVPYCGGGGSNVCTSWGGWNQIPVIAAACSFATPADYAFVSQTWNGSTLTPHTDCDVTPSNTDANFFGSQVVDWQEYTSVAVGALTLDSFGSGLADRSVQVTGVAVEGAAWSTYEGCSCVLIPSDDRSAVSSSAQGTVGGGWQAKFTGDSASYLGFGGNHAGLDHLFWQNTDGSPQYPAAMSYWYSGGAAGSGQDCTLLGIQGPDANSQFISGTTYSWTVTYSGQAEVIAVDMNDTGTYPSADITNNVPNPTSIGGGQYQATVSGTPTASGQWNVAFTCYGRYDSQFWGLLSELAGGGSNVSSSGGVSCAAGQTATPVGCGQALGSCLSNAGAGLSLTNPASWVGALIDGAGCLLSWAFVPATLSTSALTSPITGHAPYSYIADGVAGANTLIGAVSSGVSGGSPCDAPSFSFNFGSYLSHVGSTGPLGFTFPAPHALGCSDVTASYSAGLGGNKGVGDLFGFRVLIRDVATLAVWAGVLLMAWRMSPWYKPGDGVEVVARGVGLNGDGENVQTYWTNEGSD